MHGIIFSLTETITLFYMDPSILLGKVFAIFLIVAALSMLHNRARIQSLAKNMKANDPWLFVMGAWTLIFGLIFLFLHNSWDTPANIIVSILVWATVLKGVFIMLAPEKMLEMGKSWSTNSALNITGIIYLVAGLYLFYNLLVI